MPPGAYYYGAAPSVLESARYYGLLLGAATGWLFRSEVRSWAAAAFGTAAAVWYWQTWQTAGLTRLTVLPLSGGQAIYFDTPGSRNGLRIGCGSVNSAPFLTMPFHRGRLRIPRLRARQPEASRAPGAKRHPGRLGALGGGSNTAVSRIRHNRDSREKAQKAQKAQKHSFFEPFEPFRGYSIRVWCRPSH